MDVKIKTALVSVSDKNGVVDFAKALSKMGVKIISTGGTAKALSDAGVKVVGIESVTGFPEMMDGRVKTLHPKIHGALLGLRDKKEHAAAMEEHSIVGGLGSRVSDVLSEHNLKIPLKKFAINDKYINVAGNQEYLRSYFGLADYQILENLLIEIQKKIIPNVKR